MEDMTWLGSWGCFCCWAPDSTFPTPTRLRRLPRLKTAALRWLPVAAASLPARTGPAGSSDARFSGDPASPRRAWVSLLDSQRRDRDRPFLAHRCLRAHLRDPGGDVAA